MKQKTPSSPQNYDSTSLEHVDITNKAPSWLKPARHRFARVDGGSVEVAKAHLSGWEYMNLPDSVEACLQVYKAPETLERLLKAKFTHIFVTWSVGFAYEDEQRHQEEVAEFIAKAQQAGLRVTAYMSLCNMFRVSMYTNVPDSRNWVQLTSSGEETPYWAARYFGDNITRVLACLRNPGWLTYQRIRLQEAMQTGVDGVYYDNVVQQCYCSICRKAWSDYSKEQFGQSIEAPKEPQGYYWDRSVVDALEAAVTFEHQGRVWILWEEFNFKSIASVLSNFKKIAKDFNKNVVFSCNSHGLPHLDESSDFIISEDGSEPGIASGNEVHEYYSRFDEGDIVSNKGNNLFMCAQDSNVDKRVFVHELGRRLNSTRLDSHMPPRHQTLAIFEAAVYGGSLGTMYEGMFLTELFRKNRDALAAQAAIEHANDFLDRHVEWFADVKPLGRIGVVADRLIPLLSVLSAGDVHFIVLKPDGLRNLSEFDYSGLIAASASALSDESLGCVVDYIDQGGKLLIDNSFGMYDATYKERKNLGFPKPSDEGSWSTYRLGQGCVIAFNGRWNDVRRRDLTQKLTELDSNPLANLENANGISYHLGLDSKGRLLVYLLNYRNEKADSFRVRLNVPGIDAKEIEVVSSDQRKPKVKCLSSSTDGSVITLSIDDLDIAAALRFYIIS